MSRDHKAKKEKNSRKKRRLC